MTVTIVNERIRDVISVMSADTVVGEQGVTLTLDELSERVGMSVRNIRFYTSRGLVPSPIRQGRSGLYTVDHVVRLELVQELQSHGFTLAAIERFMNRIPENASPETIALHRTLLAPGAEPPEPVTRAELDRRAGRPLSDEDLHVLEKFHVVEPVGRGRYQVSGTQLAIGLGLLDLGFPVEAAEHTQEVFRRHGRQVAEELTEIFRQHVWPSYAESGAGHDERRELLQRIKPMTIAALVASYEDAVEEMRREAAARRR